MADQNRDPDVDRMQRSSLLDHVADAQRQRDLRDDRDVERALRIAGSLESAGVSQRDSDELAREAEHVQQLHTDPDDYRVMHSEYRQQLAGD